LRWAKSNDRDLVPLYHERTNRQQLTPTYRETGGVVVCKRSLLYTGSRFGPKSGIIELNRTEGIDIDNRFDWWVAEKSILRQKVCFHVVGNREKGVGHVERALALADRMIDHELWFLVNESSKLAGEIIKQRYYPVKIVSSGKELSTIIEDKPNVVINDILDTEEGFMKSLKTSFIVTVNFEDLGPGSKYADYVINEMYNDDTIWPGNNKFSGHRYACLRDEFYLHSPIKIKTSVENLLVLFGGTDPNNLTLRTIQWLDNIPGNWKITVVLGVGYDQAQEVVSFAGKSNHLIEVVNKTSVISRYMADTDIAITSGGRTVFELAAFGIPTVVIAQNERETTHVFANHSPGVIPLGLHSDVTPSYFRDRIEQLLSSSMLREKMHQTLLEAKVKDGINQVFEIIKKALERSKGTSYVHN